jgi:uncharacterized protein YndB with AHSA1/START domain
MFKNLLIGIAVVIALLAAVVAMQPSTFAIERSVQIAAPADVIYAHIESPQAMDEWSPWVAMDPKMTITHEGPASGVGAAESWEGPEMGTGRLEVTAAKPNEEVELRLEFKKPMEATNRALFTLTPAGDGTLVAWRMEGTNNFFGKAASLVMDMDEMVGGTFDKGLASLKTLAEGEAKEREAAAAAAAAAATAPPMTFDEMKETIGEPPAGSEDEIPATPPAE